MPEIPIDERRLGQYLIRAGKLLPSQLDRAIEIQTELPFLRMGEILLGMRAIAFRDLTDALYRQFSEMMLGHILVRRQFVTAERLRDALESQSKGDHRRLGEILVGMGETTAEQIQEALSERELYDEYRFKLGFNRYFEDEAGSSDLPPGWAAEVEALDRP